MTKPTITVHLAAAGKRGAIEAALKGGMSPAEIFAAVLQGVYGITQRKKVVIEWGEKLGLSSSDSLRIAHGANLIPTRRSPPGTLEEKLPRKTQEKSDE